MFIPALALAADPASAQATAGQGKKPNILILWGDDIGWNNPSCYHRGMMGYQTPNIDRLAKEGALFTDWYGQQAARRVAPRSSPAKVRSAPAC